MPLEFEQLYKLGTDVAAFLFFDPEILQHREANSIDWWNADYQKEFSIGTLAAFCTGADGQFTMKFVQRPLTSVESKVLVSKASFRFDVRNERFYWDNSDCVPCEDRLDDANNDENGWVSVSNGRYALTVYALDWYLIPDAEREVAGDISHYIVGLQPADSWDSISVPDSLPWLIPSASRHEHRIRNLKGAKGAAVGEP